MTKENKQLDTPSGCPDGPVELTDDELMDVVGGSKLSACLGGRGRSKWCRDL